MQNYQIIVTLAGLFILIGLGILEYLDVKKVRAYDRKYNNTHYDN